MRLPIPNEALAHAALTKAAIDDRRPEEPGEPPPELPDDEEPLIPRPGPRLERRCAPGTRAGPWRECVMPEVSNRLSSAGAPGVRGTPCEALSSSVSGLLARLANRQLANLHLTPAPASGAYQ